MITDITTEMYSLEEQITTVLILILSDQKHYHLLASGEKAICVCFHVYRLHFDALRDVSFLLQKLCSCKHNEDWIKLPKSEEGL